jgi:hypothetical protein
MNSKWILIAGVLALSGCTTSKPSSPPIEMAATIKDIMDSMIDPAGDFMFEAVAEIADENGVTQKAPRTEEEWKEVRNRAFILYEGMNLVMMEGRKVAQEGDKSKFPQVELEPDEIQKLIEGDRPRFFKRAKRLQDAAKIALQATDSKDTRALFGAIEHIDRACENCHLHYWYPKDSRAIAEAKNNGTFEED